MAGYDYGRWKSNNAVFAENCGKFPLSKIRASMLTDYEIKFTLEEAKILAKIGEWEPSEWHHTSKMFNETNYYSLDALWELSNDRYDEMKEKIKNFKQCADGGHTNVVYGLIEITEFEKEKRGRRHVWVPYVHTQLAVLKWNKGSDWCTYNGKRKKRTNVRILKEYSKDAFYAETSRIEEERIRSERKERLKRLRQLKQEAYVIAEDFAGHSEISDILKRIKNAKKQDTVKETTRLLLGKISELKKERFAQKLQSGEVDLQAWVSLPYELKHPAPEEIVEMKKESGLSWRGFEDAILKNGKEAAA